MSPFKRTFVIRVGLSVAFICSCFIGSKYKISSLVSGRATKDVGFGINGRRPMSKSDWTGLCREPKHASPFTPPPNEAQRQRFPQAIIIGFDGCGAHALNHLLSLHPNIVTSESVTHFYDNLTNFRKGFEWYRLQMPSSFTNQITVEKGPAYVASGKAVRELYLFDKHTKFIVIMKDPVKLIAAMSFKANVDIAKNMSMIDGELRVKDNAKSAYIASYVNHLRPWFRMFPLSQIHSVNEADLIRDPLSEIQKIEEFLEVQSVITEYNIFFNETKGVFCFHEFCKDLAGCFSEDKEQWYPLLDPITEKKLYEYFQHTNEDLFSLIGKRFTWIPGN